MTTRRWWQNGILVREEKDGVLMFDNIGKSQSDLNSSPSLLSKVENFSRASRRVVSSISGGKPVLVSDEEKKRRMSICATCEFFTGLTCKKCGCHIRFKAKLQTEHCPIGKW